MDFNAFESLHMYFLDSDFYASLMSELHTTTKKIEISRRAEYQEAYKGHYMFQMTTYYGEADNYSTSMRSNHFELKICQARTKELIHRELLLEKRIVDCVLMSSGLDEICDSRKSMKDNLFKNLPIEILYEIITYC